MWTDSVKAGQNEKPTESRRRNARTNDGTKERSNIHVDFSIVLIYTVDVYPLEEL